MAPEPTLARLAEKWVGGEKAPAAKVLLEMVLKRRRAVVGLLAQRWAGGVSSSFKFDPVGEYGGKIEWAPGSVMLSMS